MSQYFNGMLLGVPSNMFEGKSFNDFLFKPQFSPVKSRSNILLKSLLTKDFNLDIPILSSNMDTITEDKMSIEMAKNGGLGFIHRACSIEDQCNFIWNVKHQGLRVGAAVGVSGDYLKRTEALLKTGVDVILVDVAHAHSVNMWDAINEIRKLSRIPLIAGNVATNEGARFLADLGVDGIKVGIGNGSICTTRRETGAGVPQMQALRDAWIGLKYGGHSIPIIACGGMKTGKDIFFSLLMGASSVMSGRLFAGLNEVPVGGYVSVDGVPQFYRGMTSREVQKKMNQYKGAPEGISVEVEKRNESVKSVLETITGHLQSSLSYAGCRSLYELHEQITPDVERYLIPLSQESSRESFEREK